MQKMWNCYFAKAMIAFIIIISSEVARMHRAIELLTRILIMGVPLKRATSINTLIESQALIQFARELKLRTLVVVSPPFHQLRAFMTAVTVALKLYPELAIYSYAGAAMPWMAPVTHSQGTLQAQRRHLIQEELIRIDTYQKKGDLGPFDAVLDYLNRRDNKSGVAQ